MSTSPLALMSLVKKDLWFARRDAGLDTMACMLKSHPAPA
jgi:hypothetical protein